VQVVRSVVVEWSNHAVAARFDTTPETGANIVVAQQLSYSFGRSGGSESRQVCAASGAALILVRVGGLAVTGDHHLGVVDLFEHPRPTE
jgi:hypothetical protein